MWEGPQIGPKIPVFRVARLYLKEICAYPTYFPRKTLIFDLALNVSGTCIQPVELT